MSDLYFKQLEVGPMKNFCYFVGSKRAKQCYVVDPAWDIDHILATAAADGMQVIGALASHYHPDHVGGHYWGHDIPGVQELISAKPVPIYAHKAEVEGIMKLTGLSRTDFKPCESGDEITVGDVKIKTIHTPGHTPGSQCFLVQGCLVSGDTLFISGCGRVDLPGGNGDELYESLTQKIAKLPPDTVLYPGHHYDPQVSAPLDEVMKHNPYFKIPTLAHWQEVMRGRH